MLQRFKSHVLTVVLGVVGFQPSGCVSIYGHRDVLVEVTDFESGEPVAGAEISVSYATMFQLNSPERLHVTTPESGRLAMKVPTFQNGGHWSVSKDGYLMTGFHSPFSKAIRRNNPKVMDEGHFHFRLLSKPEPTAVFLLPEGFSGALRLVFESAPITPGPIVRHFEIDVPPDGLVRIRREGGLQAVSWHDTPCQFPEGTTIAPLQLSRKPSPELVGVFWLGFGPNQSMYYIGTASQARRADEYVNDVEYDKLGGKSTSPNEEHFRAAFVNPDLLDQ